MDNIQGSRAGDLISTGQTEASRAEFHSRLFVIASLAMLPATLLLPRIAQNPAYHQFADWRGWAQVPNFLNVASNLPFLIVGAMGLAFVTRAAAATSPNTFRDQLERWPYTCFFLGVMLTCLGSAYYHLAPGNDRLVWDRLPMTIAFTSFLSAMIAERVSVRWGVGLLLPLLLVGAGSVLYWDYTESIGAGDLRPYILVQFYPLIAIPFLILRCKPRYTRSLDLAVALAFYVSAKGLEVLDLQVFHATGLVSGHTLKHLAAALAPLWILRMLKRREPLT